MTTKFSISIIGAGRLGGALALAFSRKKITVESLAARDVERAAEIANLIEPKPLIFPADDFSKLSADVILIAVQDSEIETVAEQLSAQLTYQPFVFHTSGALSSAILSKLHVKGCPVGSIHPLVSISDARRGSSKFTDAYFCIEGDEAATLKAEEIVGALGGKSFRVAAEFKTLYHASAVTACGHLVALIDAAIAMLAACGLDNESARRILLPLVESTVGNLAAQTPSEALTGTFARADGNTLAAHIAVLDGNVSKEIQAIYLLLGARSLDLAEARGANLQKLEKMRGQILLAQTNLK